MLLSNNLVVGSLAYKGDTSNFTGAKVGDTITIRRPAQFVTNEFTTTVSPQAVNETSVPLVLERHFDITVELSTRQLTLSLEDFSTQVVAPAMISMAERIDGYLFSKYVDMNEIVGDGTLNSVSDLAGVNRRLMELRVPQQGRVGFINPVTTERFLSIDNLNRLDVRGAQGLQGLQEAALGRVMAIDWYAAQGVNSHVAGVPGGTPLATGTAGASTVAIASGGNAGTYRQGDIVTFAGNTQAYTVTANLTLSGVGAGTLAIAPALVQAHSSSAVTLRASHPANIVGHPRGLTLASVPLEMPMDTGTRAAYVNYGGFAIRVVYGYNMTNKMNTISFDTLVGARVTDPRLLVRFDG